MSKKESYREIIIKKSKELEWKIEGIVSCFCDTCKNIVETPELGEQKIDSALYEMLISFCNVCGKCENLKTCTACKLAYYCSRECQVFDFPKHKKICSFVKKSPPDGNMSMLYFYLGTLNYVWKGFLQLSKDQIFSRLKSGQKFYTVVQFNDGEIRGANETTMGVIETIQNNLKVLGCFTSMKDACNYQLKCAKRIKSEEKKFTLLVGQTPYSSKTTLIKNSNDISVSLGKQRRIAFQVLPFIANPENISNFLSNEQTKRRIKMLISYYWADMHVRSCVKILEIFEDEKIGMNIAEEREKGRMRYNFREREVPSIMKNEERKIVGYKSMADINHYDIVDIEVNKKYEPYIVFDELDEEIKRKFQIVSELCF